MESRHCLGGEARVVVTACRSQMCIPQNMPGKLLGSNSILALSLGPLSKPLALHLARHPAKNTLQLLSIQSPGAAGFQGPSRQRVHTLIGDVRTCAHAVPAC